MKKDNPVINGLQIEPGKVPERIEIKNELATFQELVGGHIEALMVSDRVCIIVNEEGKIDGLTPNRRFNGDILVGTILILGVDGENLTSLAEDDMAEYETMFHEPEDIDPIEIMAVFPFDFGYFG